MNMQNRIEWIDFLKGILLMFICFSHFGYLPFPFRILTFPTGNVWVPAFFFLSGVLFNENKYSSFNDYVFNKSQTLLLPYIFFFLVFIILDWNSYLEPDQALNDNILRFIHAGGPTKSAPLWFVIALFELSIVYFSIYRFVKKQFYRILIIGLFSLTGYSFSYFEIHPLFGIDILLSSLIFYAVGHLGKSFFIERNKFNNENSVIKGFLLFILFCVFCFIGRQLNPGSVLGQNKLYNYPLFLISSFSGIFAISTFCSIIWNYFHQSKLFLKIASYFNYISINALPILACHCYINIILGIILSYLSIDDTIWGFLIKLTTLHLSMFLLIVPLCYNQFYFIFGRKKCEWKSLILIK